MSGDVYWRKMQAGESEPPCGTMIRVTWEDPVRSLRFLRDPDDPHQLWRSIGENLTRWYDWSGVWALPGLVEVEQLLVPRLELPEPPSLAPVAAIVGPDDVLVLDLGPQASAQQISTTIDAIKAQRPDLVDAGRVLVCAGIAGMAVIQGAAPPRMEVADETERTYDGG